ncbi:MAG: hypothetical protein ACRYG2_37900, partial [Janthinobacterium lividum]
MKRSRSGIGVAVVAVAMSAALAGCQTHVGSAATVGGQRIGESDVSNYLTTSAGDKARTLVVQTLIFQKLFEQSLGRRHI